MTQSQFVVNWNALFRQAKNLLIQLSETEIISNFVKWWEKFFMRYKWNFFSTFYSLAVGVFTTSFSQVSKKKLSKNFQDFSPELLKHDKQL